MKAISRVVERGAFEEWKSPTLKVEILSLSL